MTNKNMAQSKYHHFVPQFYLNYFTDDTGYLYVYDKVKKEIRKSLPKNVFGKNRLNTVTYPDGSKGDWIEQQYSSIESLVSPVFKKISESSHEKTGITHMDKLFLSMFVSTQFWRLPINKPVVDESMNTQDLSFLSASLKRDGKKISDREEKEFYEKMIKTDLFQKVYPLMAGVVRPMKNGSYDDLMNWHFMYQDPGFHLTSDNPIVYKDTPREDALFRDMIFPITPGRMLLSAKNPPQRMESFELNLQQFYQAERYVAGNRADYLTTLANFYEQINKSDADKIKSIIFEGIRQSKDNYLSS